MQQVHMVPLFWGYTIKDNGEVLSPKGFVLHSRPTKDGYLQVTMVHPLTGERYWKLLHRLLAKAFVLNPRPDIFDIVDHINGDTLDNSIGNLRWLNRELNMINLHKAKNSYYNRKFGKWLAMVRGKKLGWFKTDEEARATSKVYRRKLFEQMYTAYVCGK